MSTREEVLKQIGVAIQAANGAQAKLNEAHGEVSSANQQLVQAKPYACRKPRGALLAVGG